MDKNNVQTLINNIYQKSDKFVNDFSIFDMLGQSSRELTHSAFIAQMLNPNGIHGMGSLFLSLFLKHLPVTFDFQTDSVDVEIEKDYGPKTGKGVDARGGRIDIFLKDLNGRIIVIENKIYANDQEDQLQRYSNEAAEESKNRFLLLYLTLDKHDPTNCPPTVKFHKISYKEHISSWLKECLNNIESTHPLYNIISQYMTTINTLISDQQIMDIIQQSSQNVKASLQIARLADDSRQILKYRFLTQLGKKMKLPNIEVKPSGKKEIILKTDICDWCIEHNLFLRFHQPKVNLINKWRVDHKDTIEGTPNWIYVKMGSDVINFHEYNTNASLWLDNPEVFWQKFEPIFIEIKNVFELKYNFNRNECC